MQARQRLQQQHMLHRNDHSYMQPNLQERSTLVCFEDTRVLMDLPCDSIEQAKQDVINDLQELSERGLSSSDIAFFTQLGTELVEIRSNKWRRLEAGAVVQVVVTHRGRDNSDVSGGSSSKDGLRARFAQAATGPMQVDVDGWRQHEHPYAGQHEVAVQPDQAPSFLYSVLPSPPLPSTSQDLHPGQHPESDVLAARYRQQARRDAATHPPSGQNDCQPGYLPSDKSFRPSWAARDSSLIQADDYRHPSHQHPLRADSYATRHGPHWPGSTATALSGPDFHQTPLRSHPAHTHVQPAVFSSSHIQSSTNGHAATLSLMHDFGYANAATTGVTLLDRRRASIQPMRRADRDALGRSGSPGPALAAPAPIRKHASQGFLVAYNGDSDSRARSPDGFPMHAPNAPVGNHSPTRPLPSADYPPQIVTKRASQACGIVAAAQAPLLACNTPGKTRLARPSSAAPDGSSSEQDFSPFSSDSEDDSVSDAEPDLPKDEVMQSRDQVQLAKSLQEPDRQHAVRRLRSTPEVGSSAQLSPAPHRPLRKTKGKPVPPPIASAPYSAFAPPQISVSAPGAGVAPGAGTCTLPTSGTKRAPTSWPNTPVKRNGPALSPPTPAALPASAAASFSGQPAAPHEHPQPELYPWSVPGKGKITSTCSRADSPLPALFQPRTSASHSKLGPGPDRSALVREPNHAHTRTNTGTQGSVGAESRIRGDGAAAEGGAKVRSRARSMNAAGQTSARPAHISWTSEGAPGPSSYRES